MLVQRIAPSEIPPLAESIFNLLREAGATTFALFGGALRDAEHNARWTDRREIKDYDIRIWVVEGGPDEVSLVRNLARVFRTEIREVPSPGTGRLHYCFDYSGSEVDISVRPVPAEYVLGTIPVKAVALERAADSDIGISSVAMDPDTQVWAMPEYLLDQANRTLTVFDIPDPERKAAYLARMTDKFPGHHVQYGVTDPEPSPV